MSFADVVLMDDGRRFEGTIILESEVVKIDALVAGIRVTLSLPKTEIKSIDKKAVPSGFYDPPPPPPRFSLRDPLEDPDAIYIHVPIHGEFGKDVFARGVQAAIAYAKRHRIQHVVFTIDSTGGDLDEATAIFRTLDRLTEGLHLHAIIKKCYGDAIAVPVLCETVNMAPGGSLGGLERSITEISSKYKLEEEQVVRAEMAIRVAQRAAMRGRDPQFVKALIDPQETFAIWKNAQGQEQRGLAVPTGTPKENIIVQVGDQEVLKLNYEQAIQLGIPKFSGTAKDLGKILELPKWKLESDYGSKAMAAVAKEHQAKAKLAQTRIDNQIRSNLSRRATADAYVQRNIKSAMQYSPDKGTYETYKSYGNRWRWGWGGGRSGRGGWRAYRDPADARDSGILTAESRRRWRNNSEASIHYLQQALKGLNPLKRLEAEAKKLGLSPTYKEGEINGFIVDVKKRIVTLSANRTKSKK